MILCFRIPNTPKDTQQTNEFLRYNEYPAFSKFTPSKLFTGAAKTSFDFEMNIHKHMVWLERKYVCIA